MLPTLRPRWSSSAVRWTWSDNTHSLLLEFADNIPMPVTPLVIVSQSLSAQGTHVNLPTAQATRNSPSNNHHKTFAPHRW